MERQNRRRQHRRWVGAVLATALAAATITQAPDAFADDPEPEGGSVVTLEAIADTFVSAADPFVNYAGEDFVDVYGGRNTACVPTHGEGIAPYFGLLKFDVSTLPADAVIESARVELTSRSGWAQDGDPFHHLLLVDDDWQEDTVDWSTRPDDGTAAWSNERDGLGGDEVAGDATVSGGGGDIRDSERSMGSAPAFRADCNGDLNADQQVVFPTPVDAPPYKPADLAEADLIDAIESATDGDISFQIYAADNCVGGCIAGPNAAHWARYWSREAADPAVRPRLVVQLAAEPPPVPWPPVLVRAVPVVDGDTRSTVVAGRVTAEPESAYTVEFFGSDSCPSGFLDEGATFLGDAIVNTDANGDVEFSTTVASTSQRFVVAVVIDGDGYGSDPSLCIALGPDNDTWTRALEIPLVGSDPATGSATGRVDTPGGARWYKVPVQPGARLTVRVADLPADYDLAVFKDIGQAFDDIVTPDDLTRLSAEFAPSVFSPSVFSPSVFSPSVFSPDAFAPSVFSPSVFSPSVFSPSVFSPSVFSPSVFSPSVFSPSVFSPSVFSPSVFSPSVFSADAEVPEAVGVEAFSSAQTRSLIAVSANPGTADEFVVADTWNNTGYFYLRVSGRNGAFDLTSDFSVSVELDGDLCQGVSPIAGAPSATAGGFETIVLWDSSRFDTTLPGNSTAEIDALRDRMATFADRPEIGGVVVDLADDERVQALNEQADDVTACPYAKNLVAGAIKDVVDAHRDVNAGLRYVVLVGNDAVIPFFRYPDQSLLGPESDFDPPVDPASASESSLRLNYILSQDAYGASVVLSQRDGDLPVPDLAVGRLVESASEATGMLDAYLSLDDGVVPTPSSAFVSGYDFLEDAADEVSAQFEAGLGAPVNELITANGISPDDPRSWTADDLRDDFLGERHDLAFLAGHFSANSALAADFETSMITTELEESSVDLVNSIVLSTGCHSGYTIVDGDAVPNVTLPLDWTQAFARKQATLIAGTGYQYGDTDFLEYSERIYGYLASELRTGDGPVSVGEALVRAKQRYLETTPDVRGLHRKSTLIIAVFGLPMLSVDMPGDRLPERSDDPIVSDPTLAAANPGSTLGLRVSDLHQESETTEVDVPLDNVADGGVVTATYLRGFDGVVTNPAEPALPLQSGNVSVPGTVLRGVGFRGGAYTDTPGVVPLTGAPATEIRGVHTPFTSPVWFPMRLATVNYFGALGSGETRLLVTPAQHRAEPGGITSTLRSYQSVDLRLYYSANTARPSLAAPPTISEVTYEADGDDLVVGATVSGDPAAGIQEVWIAYTGHASRWDPLDLEQCVADPDLPAGCAALDSTRWVGRVSLAGTADPDDILFIAQAANGVGLVTVDDNYGLYYGLGNPLVGPGPSAAPTTLTIDAPAATAAFGEEVSVSATLTSAGTPVAGARVVLGVGGTTRWVTTDDAGTASAVVPLVAAPGVTSIVASFPGDLLFDAASTSSTFTITKSAAGLAIDSAGVVRLTDGRGGPLGQRAVRVTFTGPVSVTVPLTTNHLGEATLPSVELPGGSYTVAATFAGDRTYLPASATGIPLVVGAQQQLAALVDQLQKLRAQLDERDALELDDAIADIERALDGAWTGPFTLDPRLGRAVFERLEDAVRHLDRVSAEDPVVDATRQALGEVARSLAEQALDDARAAVPTNMKNPDKKFAKAEAALTGGDVARSIGRFGDAWKKAQEVTAAGR